MLLVQKQHQQQDNDARTPSPTAATRGVSLHRHPQGRFHLLSNLTRPVRVPSGPVLPRCPCSTLTLPPQVPMRLPLLLRHWTCLRRRFVAPKAQPLLLLRTPLLHPHPHPPPLREALRGFLALPSAQSCTILLFPMSMVMVWL
ncbi:hypothetical protein EV2_027377 [Malus domestica]